ncbi:MAG: tRNA (guanosine(46)-N7)-methyltransferase TrmB [Anaerovoracaceae bacterium]|jgi:tRNA (guanine-N7-)-methyltransferase|nr:tRNA (guanosine(46)-N7)-methyltransferase TrmB [Anaerovoracaceae bacterium]
MRQRKAKNIEDKLNNYQGLVIKAPEKQKSSWSGTFSEEKPIYIEIGCGKGKFISSLSFFYPERNFLGIEGNQTVALGALKKLQSLEGNNVKIVPEFLRNPEDWFDEGEVSGIYLNFSDPWPKERHLKRRLTSEQYLDGYQRILKARGIIEIKTDNNILFEFTLQEVNRKNFEIMDLSRDLHKSELAAKRFTTEYEENFSNKGLAINYLKVRV